LSSNPASHEARAPKNIPLKKEETSLAVSSLEEGGEEEENRRELTTVEGKQTERVEHAEDDKKQSDEHVVIEENHSWVGVITDLEDGQVEVTWADGTVTKVHYYFFILTFLVWNYFIL
jgi:predicted RNA-binding protein with PUA domain